MTATTTATRTPSRHPHLIPILLAATAIAIEGALCFINADGYGTSSTGVSVMGVWDASADNTLGADGDTYANVQRGRQFLMFNDPTAPVTQASLGDNVYALDNQTVSTDSNTGARPVVGTFMGFDHESPMLWVEIA
jgi:hypothetical protein